MRTKYCREHIDKAAEECGLDEETVRQIKSTATFEDEHPEISGCSTSAITALIRISDPEVQETAIRLVETQLNIRTPTGGRKHTSLTRPEVEAQIKRADGEVSLKRKKATEAAAAAAKEIGKKAKATIKVTAPEVVPVDLKEQERLNEVLESTLASLEKHQAELEAHAQKVCALEDDFKAIEKEYKIRKGRYTDALDFAISIKKDIESCNKIIIELNDKMQKLQGGK